jgi:hypothetical protein
LYAIARQIATSQAIDFCDQQDASIAAAKNFVLTGTSDGSADSFIPALQADMIEVQIERYDPNTQQLGVSTDCETSPPDYVVVHIPNGYTVTPRIPYVLSDEIPLRPKVRVRYGGT